MALQQFAGRVARRIGLGGLVEHVKERQRRYRAPALPASVLADEHFAAVSRPRGEPRESDPRGAIYRAWSAIPGGHKWPHYFEAYEDLLSGYLRRPVRMLEIGVYRGGSLATWRQVLHKESVLVGIDIDPQCARFDDPRAGVHVRIGSQADGAFLAGVCDEFGPFDLIIDDGSHVVSHMIASFDHLFLRGLADDGLYVVEDTHSNFWPGFRDRPYSFVDLCKDLVDVMHAHYPSLHGEQTFRSGHPEQAASLDVPRISAQIREIRFLDSIIAIRKQPVGPLPMSVHR